MARTRTRTRKSSALDAPANPMRAVGYCRVSTDEQAEEGVSLGDQEARIRAYCVGSGLELVAVHTDKGVSGTVPLRERPAGREVARMVENREVAHVVLTKLDRGFRSAVDCRATVHAWDQAETALHLLDMGGQSVDTRTAMGRLFLGMLAEVAELFVQTIRENTRNALRHKRSRGENVGRPSLGFACPEEGSSRLEPVPAELDALRRLVELCDADLPYHQVAERLNTESVPTKRGGRWNPGSVYRTYQRVVKARHEGADSLIPNSAAALVAETLVGVA